jgi:hypothetical protein
MPQPKRFEVYKVRNRCNFKVGVVYDGFEETWEPHEERYLPAGVAQHCVYHSLVSYDQIEDKHVNRLCIVKDGEAPPPDLTDEEANPETFTPAHAMEQKTAQDGTILKPKVLDIGRDAHLMRNAPRPKDTFDRESLDQVHDKAAEAMAKASFGDVSDNEPDLPRGAP